MPVHRTFFTCITRSLSLDLICNYRYCHDIYDK